MGNKYCNVVGYKVPDAECAEIKSEKFHECDDCPSQVGQEVKDIMGEGKRKYTMSDAAMKGRKTAAIKAGARRSEKIRQKRSLIEGISPGTKQGIEPRGKCAPDIKEPVQAKEWEVTGTKRPGDELRVTLDFTEFREMYEELMALAKNEMRPPAAQILYLLKYGYFDAIKH